ncbi:hypothetical protein A3L09_03265 [Thermococcus profundus]|uniref:DUF5615 domain-containing protein n=1 Tax=Thermococcus profundus TaxID=49899 RepID=A0A2Z2MA93_THEPR|nr:DUF5615 family PIN-like protein [Thermococcus profundus]ASJ02339.1 hypothetical protein A3L09_03265 [Thermococcus profundus]
MRFLADENVPYGVVRRLKREGIDIVSVYDIKRGITDEEVARMATEENRVLVTFDKDFGMIVFVEGLKIPGLILLRFQPKNINFIYTMLKNVVTRDIDFYGKIVTVHEDKIRISKL